MSCAHNAVGEPWVNAEHSLKKWRARINDESGETALRMIIEAKAKLVGERNEMHVRQLFEPTSSTYTYIVADLEAGEGVIIDPVDVTVERDVEVAKEMGVKLLYAINTHVHADHITGTHKLKQLVPGINSVLGSRAKPAEADMYCEHREVLKFGTRFIECRHTPGHTDGCCTWVMDDTMTAFTGDTLLIRGCGRTDFQQGDSEQLYTSVKKQIFTLPPTCIIYPGHDYKGRTRTMVEEERQHNPRLTQDLDTFKEIMANLNLPYPKKIDDSLPANLRDGKLE
jgi:sulfur dioxygenase